MVDMIFDTAGNQVSPFAITNNMWEFQEVKQYQFIQKGPKKYTIKLNVDKNLFTKEERLLFIFQEKFGSDADITIEYCDEIPVLASGKRRYIVNEMLLKK